MTPPLSLLFGYRSPLGLITFGVESSTRLRPLSPTAIVPNIICFYRFNYRAVLVFSDTSYPNLNVNDFNHPMRSKLNRDQMWEGTGFWFYFLKMVRGKGNCSEKTWVLCCRGRHQTGRRWKLQRVGERTGLGEESRKGIKCTMPATAVADGSQKVLQKPYKGWCMEWHKHNRMAMSQQLTLSRSTSVHE